MGGPEKATLETLFVNMALSLKRGAHFVFASLIKSLVLVAVPPKIVLGPRVDLRLPSGLAL